MHLHLHNFHKVLSRILDDDCRFEFPRSFFEYRCPQIFNSPQSGDIINLFNQTVWSLVCASPDYYVCGGLRAAYEEFALSWASTTRKHDRWAQIHLGILGSCLDCLDVRAKLTLGLRQKRKALKYIKMLDPEISDSFCRPGIADMSQCNHLVEFLLLQVLSHFGCSDLAGHSFLYRLAHGKHCYIGKCDCLRRSKNWGGGACHRLREHVKALQKT